MCRERRTLPLFKIALVSAVACSFGDWKSAGSHIGIFSGLAASRSYAASENAGGSTKQPPDADELGAVATPCDLGTRGIPRERQELGEEALTYILGAPLVAGYCFMVAPPLFRGSRPDDIFSWPPVPSGPDPILKINLAVSAGRLVNGERSDHFYSHRFTVSEIAERVTRMVYRESRLFGGVTTGDPDADLSAVVHVSSTGNYSSFTTISRYTLGIIPSFSGETFRIDTTITDSSGNTVFHDIREDEPVYVRTFPRLQTFTEPAGVDLFSASRVAERIIYDLNRETLYQFYFRDTWNRTVAAKQGPSHEPANTPTPE